MRTKAALASLAAMVAGLALASPASALIYWGNGETIKRATNAGAGAHVFISGADDPCGLAVSSTHIYWANRGSNAIARARLDGSQVDQAFISTMGEPCGVALDQHLFWAAGGTIGRADLGGGGVNHSFIPSGGSFICGLAVGVRLFWANESSGRIGRAEVNGTGVNHNFISGAGIPCGVAVNATHVYWTNQGFESVGRATVAGLDVDQTLIQSSVASAPCGVALDPTQHLRQHDRAGQPGWQLPERGLHQQRRERVRSRHRHARAANGHA
jgi:virginiamycin B lyase